MLWVLRFWLTKVPIIGLWSIGVTSCGSARTRIKPFNWFFALPRMWIMQSDFLSHRATLFTIFHTIINEKLCQTIWEPKSLHERLFLFAFCSLTAWYRVLCSLYCSYIRRNIFRCEIPRSFFPLPRIIPELLRPNEKKPNHSMDFNLRNLFTVFDFSSCCFLRFSWKRMMKICWRRNQIKEWRRRRGTSERERLKLSWCLFIFSFYYLLARSDDTFKTIPDLFTVDWVFDFVRTIVVPILSDGIMLRTLQIVVASSIAFYSNPLFFFSLQIKTRGGWWFYNYSSNGTAPTDAEHSTAVDGQPTDGSRWEENAPSNRQQQRAPPHAEYQRWIPKFASTFAPPRRREAQQGESLKIFYARHFFISSTNSSTSENWWLDFRNVNRPMRDNEAAYNVELTKWI